MEYRDFVKRVRDRAGLESDERALQVAQATLRTLSERLCGGEAQDFLSQLPKPVKLSVDAVPETYPYTIDEFIERVSEQEETDLLTARDHARVVLEVLAEATSAGEFADICSQLPREYESLVPGAGRSKSPPGTH